MLRELFEEFIELSRTLRPDYPESLGLAKEKWQSSIPNFTLPTLIHVIYSVVQGTERDIRDQKLMDFIPGFRLIHIEELVNEKKCVDEMLNEQTDIAFSFVLPILANYSSDYICYVENINGNHCICLLLHDEGKLELISNSSEKFFETIIEFYKQQVYFLDSEGYLSYDWNKEGDVGSKLNPDVEYWNS